MAKAGELLRRYAGAERGGVYAAFERRAPCHLEKVNVALVDATVPAGPESIVGRGGATVSASGTKETERSKVLSITSFARTSRNVCAPWPRLVNCVGEVQEPDGTPSRRHSNVAPASGIGEREARRGRGDGAGRAGVDRRGGRGDRVHGPGARRGARGVADRILRANVERVCSLTPGS